MKYPCQFCGECPVWLSYGEEGGPQTDAELELECKMRKCNLIGRSVFEQEMFEGILGFMNEVVRYIETTPEMPPIPKDNRMKQLIEYVSNTLNPHKENVGCKDGRTIKTEVIKKYLVEGEEDDKEM